MPADTARQGHFAFVAPDGRFLSFGWFAGTSRGYVVASAEWPAIVGPLQPKRESDHRCRVATVGVSGESGWPRGPTEWQVS